MTAHRVPSHADQSDGESDQAKQKEGRRRAPLGTEPRDRGLGGGKCGRRE